MEPLKPRHKKALLKVYRHMTEYVTSDVAKLLVDLQDALDRLEVKIPADGRRNWKEYQ